MPRYRRAKHMGGTFFFTVVTYRRRPLFAHAEAREILRRVIKKVRQSHPFEIDAWVLLPEHMHCIWTLPQEDADFSMRWSLIKSTFTKAAKTLYHVPEQLGDSRRKHREATIWQRRFWEHQIRSEEDYKNHIDYIHFNPVKHGLADQVGDWPFSTFHRYVQSGIYPEDWGGKVEGAIEGNYGEYE
jgi:putative transposase